MLGGFIFVYEVFVQVVVIFGLSTNINSFRIQPRRYEEKKYDESHQESNLC